MKHTKLVFAIPLLFGMVLAQAAPSYEPSNGSVCLNSFSRKISGAIAWWMCSGKHSNRKLISLWSFFFADGGFSAATLA